MIAFQLLALSGVLTAAPALAGSVGGIVRDAATLDPLEGFEVTLHVINPDSMPLSTSSGPGGAYLITDVPPGNEFYILTSIGPGFANFYARLQDPGSGHLTFDVLLDSLVTPPGGGGDDSSKVMGHVLTSPEQGTMVPVANALLTWRSGTTEYAGYTDAQGGYEITVPTGIYSVTVAADGYQPVTDTGIAANLGGLSYSAVLESVTGVPGPGIPGAIELLPARPNPFQGSTRFGYSLAQGGDVELGLFDLMGREVARLVADWKPAGTHFADLTAEGLRGGVYFCMLRSGGRIAMRRVTLLP
jgi:hypothetical protein